MRAASLTVKLTPPVIATRCQPPLGWGLWHGGKVSGSSAKQLAPGDTPSVIACGDATFPKGTAFGGGDKVFGIVQRRPLGGAGEHSEPEGVAFGMAGKFPA